MKDTENIDSEYADSEWKRRLDKSSGASSTVRVVHIAKAALCLETRILPTVSDRHIALVSGDRAPIFIRYAIHSDALSLLYPKTMSTLKLSLPLSPDIYEIVYYSFQRQD